MKLSKKATLLLSAFTLFLTTSIQGAVMETPKEATHTEIAVLLPGIAKDNGFMEAGYRGYERIAQEITPNVLCLSDVSPTSDEKTITEALRTLAGKHPSLIIAHGGQCNGPVQTVSKEYPHIEFVVIQGNVQGENKSSYKVNQEQSAFLAGALAGYMTETNKVGHISGAWPKPGLQARAAFYHGLHYANPKAQFYTHFTGNLDDCSINAKAAKGEIEAGCDIIYTMLNNGRYGVNEEIEKTNGKVKEIGNVIDWTNESPIFIGSAVADSSVAIVHAAKDYRNHALSHTISLIGLEDNEVVRLAMSPKVPKKIKKQLMNLKEAIQKGEIFISTDYTGPEFNPETNTFVDQEAKNHK